MNTTYQQFTLINEQTQTVERLRERQQADKDLTTFSDYEILQLLISYIMTHIIRKT